MTLTAWPRWRRQAFTRLCLAHLLKACRPDALGLPDAALLRIAYDTAARRSELVAIEAAHVEGPDAEGAGLLHIPSSKTDRKHAGAEAYLSPATMAAIARWHRAASITRGPLLRRVITHFDGSIDRIGAERLPPNNITPIVQRLIRRHGKRACGGRWARPNSSAG